MQRLIDADALKQKVNAAYDLYEYESRNDCIDDSIVGVVPRDTVLEVIALLKAQEPNEDWISRKRLKDEIQYYIEEAGWGDEANKVLGWCLEFIDNQAAVKWE